MSRLKNLDDSGIHYGIYARMLKRPLDFILSFIALIVLLPIVIVLCVLVRIKLGSPIFFKQSRAGMDEKTFKMIKFRTMTDAKDENGQLLPDEARFTKFGSFLRNYSLDELPELINVIKGDMSLIGPRPLYTYYLPYYTDEEALRHVVRGGITGLAQINGRVHCPMDLRLKYDVEYVRNITFIKDVKLLFKTIGKVIHADDVGQPSLDDEKCINETRSVQRVHLLELEK